MKNKIFGGGSCTWQLPAAGAGCRRVSAKQIFFGFFNIRLSGPTLVKTLFLHIFDICIFFRFYGEYTKDIKDNLERGTAV